MVRIAVIYVSKHLHSFGDSILKKYIYSKSLHKRGIWFWTVWNFDLVFMKFQVLTVQGLTVPKTLIVYACYGK